MRKVLGLLVEAAKEEVRLWKTPPRALEAHIEPELVVEVQPETFSVPVESHLYQSPPVSSWRGNSKRMQEALDATTCPDCDAPKGVGWFQCEACRPKKAAS